jgi:hypothetical protein
VLTLTAFEKLILKTEQNPLSNRVKIINQKNPPRPWRE